LKTGKTKNTKPTIKSSKNEKSNIWLNNEQQEENKTEKKKLFPPYRVEERKTLMPIINQNMLELKPKECQTRGKLKKKIVRNISTAFYNQFCDSSDDERQL
jgi:hypothetical protein